jgi:hypothetical protein
MPFTTLLIVVTNLNLNKMVRASAEAKTRGSVVQRLKTSKKQDAMEQAEVTSG